MQSEELQHQVYNTLRRARHVFLTAHPGCGDALGSTLALALWLHGHGIAYTAFSSAIVPEHLRFLGLSHTIVTDSNSFQMSQFDVVVVMDSDYRMTGISKKLEQEIDYRNTIVINIDHHFTNAGIGEIAIVDHTASATTVLLYDFFKVNSISLTPAIATCLLTGILVDTAMFTNGATNDRAFAVAAELLLAGASLHTITSALIRNKTVPLLQLWGAVLSRIQYNPTSGAVTTAVLLNDLQQSQLSNEATQGIANFVSMVGDGYFSMFLKEDEQGLVKCSLRTTRDDVDVSALARVFGGGGHRKSAGFAIPGSLLYNEQQQTITIV